MRPVGEHRGFFGGGGDDEPQEHLEQPWPDAIVQGPPWCGHHLAVARPLPLEPEHATLDGGALQHLHRALAGRTGHGLTLFGEVDEGAHIGHADLLHDLGAADDQAHRLFGDPALGEVAVGLDAIERPVQDDVVGDEVQPDGIDLDPRAPERPSEMVLDGGAPSDVGEDHTRCVAADLVEEVPSESSSQLRRAGNDGGLHVGTARDRLQRSLPQVGLVEPAFGIGEDLGQLSQPNAEVFTELAKCGSAPPVQEPGELFGVGLEDGCSGAELPGQPQPIGPDR